VKRIFLSMTFSFALTLSAIADTASARYVSFLACPIARDTGPDTDVCFFAEHEGQRYALANPPDWGVPQLHHRVLVEGVVKDAPAVCGASPLEGRTSVMRDIDDACAAIVPYDEVVKGVAGGVFNSGSAQQRAYAQDLARRVATDPSASIEPAILDPPTAPLPVPPFEARSLLLVYPFDSTRAAGPDMVKLKEMVEFIRIAKVHHVTVTGYRAVSHLSDGTELEESADLARDRAQKIGAIMVRLGVGAKVMRIAWESQPIPGTGREDWRNRKVEINVEP
jgi:outer membrane protein OmpA-like peptidoglycan-associated protein